MRWIFGLIVLSAFAFQACESSSGKSSSDKPAETGVDGYVVETRQLENNVPATGTLLPNEEVELRSEISGRVEKIHFREGDEVSKGDLLLQIDDDALQAQLDKLKSQIGFAEKRLNRQTELRDVEGVSEEAVEEAQTTLDELKADRKRVESDIRNSRVYAPFSGVVGLRMISPGSFVEAGAAIANLVQKDPVKIEFAVPASYATQLKPGTPVDFKISGMDSTFTGEIYATEPRINPSTRMLNARARCGNPEGLLVPGAFADLKVRLEKVPNAMMIPTESVVPELGRQIVYIAQNGQIEKREVRTGVRQERMIQVLSGLQPGDTVLTTGILGAKPGKPIRIKKVVNEELWSPEQ